MLADDVPERGRELSPRPCILTVDMGGVGVPELRDFADREVFAESQTEQLDPAFRPVARVPGPVLLEPQRLAEDRARPGPVEDGGERLLASFDGIEIEPWVGLQTATEPSLLEPPCDVLRNSVEVGAKAARTTGVHAIQGAVLLEALQKCVLHRVVELAKKGRAAPAGTQVGPDDGLVSPGELVSRGTFAPGRTPDQRPPCRVTTRHTGIVGENVCGVNGNEGGRPAAKF